MCHRRVRAYEHIKRATDNELVRCLCRCVCRFVAAGLKMPVHDRVKGFIRQQVHDGVTNVAEVARHTESFVKHQLFPDQPLPSRLNRRYYPTRRDLTNLIYRERIALICTPPSTSRT